MFFGIGFGVAAAFFWSISNLVDKYLVDKYADKGNVGGILLLSCFFPFFLMLCALFFSEGVNDTSLENKLILMLAGMLMVSWIYFYLKALYVDDASTVMTLLVLAPFFSLIFGNVILGEWLTSTQLIGGGLIICGAISVSFKPHEMQFKYTLLLYAIAAAVVTALMSSLFKLVTIEDDFWKSIFWRSLGMILSGFILYISFKNFRSSFHNFVSEHIGKGLSLNTINETLTLVGDSLFAFGILFAPLAIVQTTEAYQPIFIFIMILILTRFGLIHITESFDNTQSQLKLLGILLVLSGSIVLSLFY